MNRSLFTCLGNTSLSRYRSGMVLFIIRDFHDVVGEVKMPKRTNFVYSSVETV